MITLVFGVPGSGKTYFMAHTIKKRVLQEGDIFLKVKEDCLLITNLKLRLDSPEGYVYVDEWENWMQFLNVNFWQQNFAWWKGKRVWIVMDECQRFFAIAKENPEVWFYLQYHRHFGTHNLIFATQTPKSIPGKLYELCEFIVEAVPKSVNVFSVAGFRYRVLSPLDKSLVLRRFHLPYDHVTFYLYSDMVFKEDEEMRPQNAFIKPILISLLALLGLIIALNVFLSGFSKSGLSSKANPNTQTQTQTQITYEDLITEIKEEQPKEPQEPPKEEPKAIETPLETPRPEEPGGYYYIALEKTRAKAEMDLTPSEPKVIYLP
jgi:hypothetical protein